MDGRDKDERVAGEDHAAAETHDEIAPIEPDLEIVPEQESPAEPEPEEELDEIGRASCRERV